MDINEFRVKHSELVEQYQFIEFHLEGLFALMQNDGDDFLELAHRVENDAMGELIRKVRFLIKEKKHQDVMTKNDFAILDDIRDDRNFWCHSNYLEINKDGETYKIQCERITNDLTKTIDMNNHLKDVFQKLM